MKLISVVSGCFNEEDNVTELCDRVRCVFDSLDYDYEHILIDNCSTDRTVAILREIAAKDPHVKVIVNARNFGHIRSGCHGLKQAKGDAVIGMASDLQDPPEMIPEFIRKWEEGFKIVLAVKTNSEESPVFFAIRKLYYSLVTKLSDIELVKNASGFGLYDKAVIDIFKSLDDAYPYFRGLICDIGFQRALIPFSQPARKRGITKNNFYTLYDNAMLGITNHSKVPLRLAAMSGFLIGVLSMIFAAAYLVYKLIYWEQFQVGIAPLVIGLFFFGAVQLFFIGILGEYIGSIHTQIMKRPMVVERERINFDRPTAVSEHTHGKSTGA